MQGKAEGKPSPSTTQGSERKEEVNQLVMPAAVSSLVTKPCLEQSSQSTPMWVQVVVALLLPEVLDSLRKMASLRVEPVPPSSQWLRFTRCSLKQRFPDAWLLLGFCWERFSEVG